MITHEVQSTDFNIEDIDNQIIGAGIIPICCTKQGIKILLGKERYVSHWRGSLKWSGFEGGRKENESIEFSAAREFVEECMGAVSFDGVNKMCSIAEVYDRIKNNEYFMRIILCINHNDLNFHEKRFHVTYVFEVPEQDECVERFMKTRKLFLELQFKIIQYKKLFENVQNNAKFPFENKIFDDIYVTAITNIYVDTKSVKIKVLDDNFKEINIYIPEDKYTEAELSTYIKWFSHRIEIHEEVKNFQNIENSILIESNVQDFFFDAINRMRQAETER